MIASISYCSFLGTIFQVERQTNNLVCPATNFVNLLYFFFAYFGVCLSYFSYIRLNFNDWCYNTSTTQHSFQQPKKSNLWTGSCSPSPWVYILVINANWVTLLAHYACLITHAASSGAASISSQNVSSHKLANVGRLQKMVLPPIHKKCCPLSTKFVLTQYKMSDTFYGSEGVDS